MFKKLVLGAAIAALALAAGPALAGGPPTGGSPHGMHGSGPPTGGSPHGMHGSGPPTGGSPGGGYSGGGMHGQNHHGGGSGSSPGTSPGSPPVTVMPTQTSTQTQTTTANPVAKSASKSAADASSASKSASVSKAAANNTVGVNAKTGSQKIANSGNNILNANGVGTGGNSKNSGNTTVSVIAPFVGLSLTDNSTKPAEYVYDAPRQHRKPPFCGSAMVYEPGKGCVMVSNPSASTPTSAPVRKKNPNLLQAKAVGERVD